MEKLSDTDIKAELQELKGWELLPDRPAIHKKLKFRDFPSTWNFMDDVAGYAEEIGHHPEWTNIYNRLEITLTTHDAGGVTELDLDMAAFINAAEAEY